MTNVKVEKPNVNTEIDETVVDETVVINNPELVYVLGSLIASGDLKLNTAAMVTACLFSEKGYYPGDIAPITAELKAEAELLKSYI